MSVCTVIAQYSRNGHWAFATNDTLGGVETTMSVRASTLSTIITQNQDLRIKGISMMYFRAGGGVVVLPRITSTSSSGVTAHYLSSWTTVGNTDQRSITPLDIPTSLDPATTVIQLAVTTQAADTIRISAWGDYITNPSAEPIAVDVKSVQFIRRSAQTGPV